MSRDGETVPQQPPGSAGEQVLANAQAGREVVQDFVPLADSLEWQLGQQYLRQRGNKAFLSDASPVPFVVNNDGALSKNAAEVFFASLVAAEKAGSGDPRLALGDPRLALEDEIFVLELGIGVGLFARYFLDHFRELCWREKKDYYSRLRYIAADKSERMLHDVLRHGVLADHPGRYCVRVIDAMKPEETLPGDVLFRGTAGSGDPRRTAGSPLTPGPSPAEGRGEPGGQPCPDCLFSFIP